MRLPRPPNSCHDTHIFVALDDRERCRRSMPGAGVLLDLAAVRVFVGAADPRRQHPNQHGARLEVGRVGVGAQLEFPRGDKCGGTDIHAEFLESAGRSRNVVGSLDRSAAE